MANLITKTRTNYVEISDIERFKEIIAHCCAEDEISVITHTENDKRKYGFICDGNIDGFPLPNDNCDKKNCKDCEKYSNYLCDPDYSFDTFTNELQKVIVPGDALIITTISYENLKYLQGETIIITSECCKLKTLESIGMETAREMLNNPKWDTRNYY